MWQTERQGTPAMSITHSVESDDLMMTPHFLDSSDIIIPKSKNHRILVFLSLPTEKHSPFSEVFSNLYFITTNNICFQYIEE